MLDLKVRCNTATQRRALFYSHDTVGLGHLRRTMLICEGLGKRLDNLSTLIVTGSPMAHGFRMPQGVDYVKMPSVVKLDNELYESRTLPIPFQQTLALREEIIFRTVSHYQPDFFFGFLGSTAAIPKSRRSCLSRPLVSSLRARKSGCCPSACPIKGRRKRLPLARCFVKRF